MPCELGRSAFTYPAEAYVRRHGPSGYVDYRTFKPWLRDEFYFRCVFCLVRERWYPNGADCFGVDHLIPKSVSPHLECAYDNLLYLCNRCNSAKRISLVLDPCQDALGQHLRVEDNGVVISLTREGEQAIDAFNLNNPRLQLYRRNFMEKLCRWADNGDNDSLEWELGYPLDLPRLDTLRCKNNVRPTGIEHSHFARRHRGELPARY